MKNICSIQNCKHKARGKYCYMHEKRLYRAKYPMKAAYQNLRSNAKRRKKIFTLTLEQFEAFCIKTLYLFGKGKTRESFSIDCIIESKGYTADNIRVLTLAANTTKENVRRRIFDYDWESKTGYVYDSPIVKQVAGLPF